MKVMYIDKSLDVEIEFASMIELAAWLTIPVFEVANVLDYGKVFEDWTAYRIKEAD